MIAARGATGFDVGLVILIAALFVLGAAALTIATLNDDPPDDDPYEDDLDVTGGEP